MSSVRYEKSDFLAYALYNIPAKSDEDRSCTSINHAADRMECMASFGVFDGHMGVRRSLTKLKYLRYDTNPNLESISILQDTASKACANDLHSMVALNCRNLSDIAMSKNLAG